MALSAQQIAKLRMAAEDRGLDPEALIAAAEGSNEGGSGNADDAPAAGAAQNNEGLPLNERLLIGHIPYLRVRELRKLFLRLDEDVPDQDMMTGEWLRIYGGTAPSGGGDDEAA